MAPSPHLINAVGREINKSEIRRQALALRQTDHDGGSVPPIKASILEFLDITSPRDTKRQNT